MTIKGFDSLTPRLSDSPTLHRASRAIHDMAVQFVSRPEAYTECSRIYYT